jgi:diguanylate cyclase
MVARTPHEIAREAVKHLTANKLPPTPDNYQAAYHEIAGTRPLRPFPLEQLRRIAQDLPDRSPGQQRLKNQIESAVNQHNWEALQTALVAYASLGPAPVRPAGGLAAPAHHTTTPTTPGLPADLLEQVARVVDHTLPAVGNDDAKLAEQGQDLVNLLRSPQPETAALRKHMANFAFRLSFVAEEQNLVRETLLGLMRLMFDNIGELSQDNPWIRGQMDALMQAATPPLNTRRLEELQSRLKDVIHKQSEAKARTLEAQAQIKAALASFIDRLSRMTEDSGQFSAKIEKCARQLEDAHDLTEITPVLQEAIQASRSMALDTRRATEELNQLRDRTTEAEIEIARLQQELDRLSEMARHDPLTGALNRKGLDEAVDRELARAQRRQSQICLGLLDIDNFKKLNDTHGHDTGDAALVHLSDVVRLSLRPQDSLARYGGEEFVVVMPDTTLEQAVEAMTRVQRNLTTQLFMQGNDRLLITFSAGVAQWQEGETGQQVIKRADQGMYLAKRAGKNRVVAV